MKKILIKKMCVWLDGWAKFRNHPRCMKDGIKSEFGEGYKQAIMDVVEYIHKEIYKLPNERSVNNEQNVL